MIGFALSNSRDAFRYSKGLRSVQEIKSLGFDEVELGYNFTSLMFEEIADFVKKSFIRVASLHNFCPISPGLEREKALPDYYSLASTYGNE